MRSLLRVAAVLSSLTLFLCGVWLAQIQAHGQAPAMPGSKSGVLRVPIGDVLQPPPMIMSSSKSFSGTVIKGDLLLRKDLWSAAVAKNDDKSQEPARRAHVDAPELVTLETSRGGLLKFSLFQGSVSVPGLPPLASFEMEPRPPARLRLEHTLTPGGDLPRTLVGVMPEPGTTLGWNVLLPAYSDAETVYLPTLHRWALPMEAWPAGSSIHRPIKGRNRAWLGTELAKDFRQLTQDAHPAEGGLLIPFLFRNDHP